MLTYQEARTKFANCKDPEKGFKLSSGSRLLKSEESFVVRLYETNIVELSPDGEYRIDPGGWYTPYTRQEIEKFSPVRIRTDKGLWLIDGKATTRPFTRAGGGYRFDEDALDAAEALKINATFTRETAKFRKNLCAEFSADTLGTPGPGDCWICGVMRSSELFKGTNTGQCGHLWAHIAERYHVPTLLYAALIERHMGGWQMKSVGATEDPETRAQKDWSYSRGVKDPWMINAALRRFFNRRRQAMVLSYPGKEAFERIRKEA